MICISHMSNIPSIFIVCDLKEEKTTYSLYLLFWVFLVFHPAVINTIFKHADKDNSVSNVKE